MVAKVKLHRCRFTFVRSKTLSACYRVQSALDDRGIEYEIVTEPYLPRRRRKELIGLSGQVLLPVVEFQDGSTYRAESKDMAAAIYESRLFEHRGQRHR